MMMMKTSGGEGVHAPVALTPGTSCMEVAAGWQRGGHGNRGSERRIQDEEGHQQVDGVLAGVSDLLPSSPSVTAESGRKRRSETRRKRRRENKRKKRSKRKRREKRTGRRKRKRRSRRKRRTSIRKRKKGAREGE